MAPAYYTFTGRGVVPRHVTHVLIDKALKFVRSRAFSKHPNIQEVICHDGVEKIERLAFYKCPRLRRVIMPGVKVVETGAFNFCYALTYIEWGKLEIIGEWAFGMCISLRSIDLLSVKNVGLSAFAGCLRLTNVKFSKVLESIGGRVFVNCSSLERITLPLKDGMLGNGDTFAGCKKLNHVDLVEGAILTETISALHMDEWKNDMSEEINAINLILGTTPAGNAKTDFSEAGGKAREIEAWIESVLRKIIHYKVEHHSIMDEAAATIQLVLPQDIVRNNVLSFLELPSYTFDGEDDEEEEENSDEDEEMDEEE